VNPKVKSVLKLLWTITKRTLLWFFISSLLLVVLYRFVPVPFTLTMISRSFEQMFDGKEMVWKHDWVSLDEMSPNLMRAVVASEDNLFRKHNGFSWEAIQRAMEHNKKGKTKRGGSTISQQTAKNVFLWQGRSYFRKGLEVYFTFLIEWVWGKERIMEVYLNSIEMGNGIYGAEAASNYWYKKSAFKLSPREAAGIAAILPAPRRFKASNSTPYINGRKDKIEKLMHQIGSWTFEDEVDEKEEKKRHLKNGKE